MSMKKLQRQIERDTYWLISKSKVVLAKVRRRGGEDWETSKRGISVLAQKLTNGHIMLRVNFSLLITREEVVLIAHSLKVWAQSQPYYLRSEGTGSLVDIIFVQ